MRPALKKIADALKGEPSILDLPEWNKTSWNAVVPSRSRDAFIIKHCHKLRKPVHIPAGTKWIDRSSSGSITGHFIKDCNAIGVVKFKGLYIDVVLDREASAAPFISAEYLEKLSALDTELLEKIAEQM